jgi:hypothetical protein
MIHVNMPSNVSRFEKLMYLSLASDVIVFLSHWYTDGLVLGPGIALSAQALNLVFFVLFIWLTARRRKNWARWALVIAFLFSTESYVRILLPYWRTHGSIAFFFLAVQVPAQLVALIFVFTGNARDWFNQPTAGVNSAEQSALS